MISLFVIVQLYTFNVIGFMHGNHYYAQISPKKAYKNEVLVLEPMVIMILQEKSKVTNQHFLNYGDSVYYFRLKCDIIDGGKAVYMNHSDYMNDKSTMKNLRE